VPWSIASYSNSRRHPVRRRQTSSSGWARTAGGKKDRGQLLSMMMKAALMLPSYNRRKQQRWTLLTRKLLLLISKLKWPATTKLWLVDQMGRAQRLKNNVLSSEQDTMRQLIDSLIRRIWARRDHLGLGINGAAQPSTSVTLSEARGAYLTRCQITNLLTKSRRSCHSLNISCKTRHDQNSLLTSKLKNSQAPLWSKLKSIFQLNPYHQNRKKNKR